MAELNEPEIARNGRECPNCGQHELRVKPGGYVRHYETHTERIKICANCGYKVTTEEVRKLQ